MIHKPQATQQYVVQIAAAPATADEDRYAARLLSTIVGDDSGSRLFWELVDTGLAEYAAIGAHEFQGAGIYMSYLSCAPDSAAENLQRIAEIVAEVEAEGITPEELTQAQNKICAEHRAASRAARQPDVRRRQQLDSAAAIPDDPRGGRMPIAASPSPTSPPCCGNTRSASPPLWRSVR